MDSHSPGSGSEWGMQQIDQGVTYTFSRNNQISTRTEFKYKDLCTHTWWVLGMFL